MRVQLYNAVLFWKGSSNPNPFDFSTYVFEPLHRVHSVSPLKCENKAGSGKKPELQKLAQKRPQSLCQVHAQQSNADDTEGSFRQVCHDAIEPIAALANSKFALDNVAITDILILLFLCLLRPFRVLCRSSQGRPGQLDALGFAPGNGLPVPVDFVNKNPLRIATMLLTVALYGAEKIGCFVVGIKR